MTGGKKRKRANKETLEDLLARPVCYYCEKDFDDINVLTRHQRQKHFKCTTCGKQMHTAGGLGVHMSQVHKESLTMIQNALDGRQDPGIEIFGEEGVPESIVADRKQKITFAYFQMQREQGGGKPGGAANTDGGKKPKVTYEEETSEQRRARLQEHRERKRAEKEAKKAAEEGGGRDTPDTQGEVRWRMVISSLLRLTNLRDQNSDANMPDVGARDASTAAPGSLHAFGMGIPGQLPGSEMYQQQPPPPYGQIPNHFGQASPAGYPGYAPYGNYGQPPYAGGPPQNAPANHGAHGGYPNFKNHPPASLPQAAPTTLGQADHKSASPPARTSGLPAPGKGLPQRPSFALPNLSKEDMARMHGGHTNQPYGGLPGPATSPGAMAFGNPPPPSPYGPPNAQGGMPYQPQMNHSAGLAFRPQGSQPPQPVPGQMYGYHANGGAHQVGYGAALLPHSPGTGHASGHHGSTKGHHQNHGGAVEHLPGAEATQGAQRDQIDDLIASVTGERSQNVPDGAPKVQQMPVEHNASSMTGGDSAVLQQSEHAEGMKATGPAVEAVQTTTGAQPKDIAETAEPKSRKKKDKKKNEKDGHVKRLYTDDVYSPEETLARREKYRFTPRNTTQTTFSGEGEDRVTGAVDDGASEN